MRITRDLVIKSVRAVSIVTVEAVVPIAVAFLVGRSLNNISSFDGASKLEKIAIHIGVASISSYVGHHVTEYVVKSTGDMFDKVEAEIKRVDTLLHENRFARVS